jgi:chloride channel protein, CIC family
LKEKHKNSLSRIFKRYHKFKRSLLLSLSKLTFPEYTVYTIYSIIIGIAAGLAAVLFHHSIDFFNKVFFEQTAEGLFFLGAAAVIILPALGMFIQAVMIRTAPDIAKRKGVAEVIKTVAVKGGYIPLRTTFFHFLAPVISIGSGGSVGPEGPAAQLGGGVASKIGTFLGLSDDRVRIFTAAGAGAAIAAIFNTPLGGVFFALEVVLLNDFRAPAFSSLILASVSASAVSRILLGNESVFIFESVQVINYSNLYLFLILGALSGIISLLFIKYSLRSRYFFKKIYDAGVPQWIVMVTVGLVVGISGYFYKEIFGIGYTAINEILTGNLSWQIVLIILCLKFILVPLILYSGGFGGVFAPSLFMGASFGYLFAYVLNYTWGLNIDPVIMILVGMGAMLGGINTIPISAILIVFEMTQDYSYILPLMLAVIISNMIVQVFIKGSVHMKNLEAEGFKLFESKDVNLLKSILVSDVDLEPIDLINDDTTLPEMMTKIIGSPNSSFYTIDSMGNISGIITETELRPILMEYEMIKDIVIARDIANPNIQIIKLTDNLDYVLNMFSKLNPDQFPVVHPDDPKNLLGAITRQKVLSIYNRETLKLNLTEGLAKELQYIGKNQAVQIVPGYSIIEETVPFTFSGKTLSELKLRNSYGIEVLMLRQFEDIYSEEKEPKILTPDPHYRLRATDKLILFGNNESLEKFKNENY